MGLRQEAVVREFCACFGDGSYERQADVEKIVSMMSEDAEWQLWVPGGPTIKGRAAIRQELERQKAFLRQNRCNIKNILSNDTVVMTERVDDAVLFGRDAWHTMVAVYELDGDGLISKWREYLDTADLAAKKKGPVLPAYREQYAEA